MARIKKTVVQKLGGGLLDERELDMAALVERLLPSPLESADQIAFALLAVKLREWSDLFDRVKKDGVTEYSDRSGVTHLSPTARREAEVFGEVLALLKAFSLTPASRAKLAASLKGAEGRKPTFAGFISADPGKPME